MTHDNSTTPAADAPGADLDRFVDRHLGPRAAEQQQMLQAVGHASLDALADAVVPASIRLGRALDLPPPLTEQQALARLRELAAQNERWRSFIGAGYYDTLTPPVIQRNILENPGWYTQYTPYQPEISQGRLEALLIFQTMIAELTGFPLANASLLDEATAAAEAMTMCRAISRRKSQRFFVDQDCHPQTIAVVQTRARPLQITVEVGDAASLDPAAHEDLFGVLVQYPSSSGRVVDYASLFSRARDAGVLTAVATDLLALTLLRPPGELGADIALGSSQRFGVPLGFGGPHAAFFATRDEHKRLMPGRIIGASKDVNGRLAYRLALQTREQHIRREKATSNICTAQVLLAITAAMYAVYHGPRGLRRIAERVHRRTAALAEGLRRLGFDLGDASRADGVTFFDTLRVRAGDRRAAVLSAAAAQRINLRVYDDGSDLGLSLDEATSVADLEALLAVFAAAAAQPPPPVAELQAAAPRGIPERLARAGECLRHEAFSRYHSEHQLTRYLQQLQNRDLSLTTSMIPLGSCTMKLNPTAAMMPITWPELGGLHPFVPPEQARGYAAVIAELERWLAEITGFAAISFQPNAGAQGEYAGLLVIRAYHEQRGEATRDVCLIPVSAHGTNPASAVLAGMRVVTVACDEQGNIDVADLEAKAEQHAATLGALMVTYPSTHGVFEEQIRRICDIVHARGGQVYLDGANMNAQVGLCRPAEIGADVCHLNLHKTFAIPHGGGGPGMGPIGVAAHLAPFLPGHPLVRTGGEQSLGTISAAPYGSPSILPISWAYIAMMGAEGLRRASQVAILNANYLARRIGEHFPVLYTGERGLVAHEFIVDMRDLKKRAGVTVDDVAKRLMDFGFHAPTMSFPVPGTMMIEPTESEDRAELDRFCLAMATIREEIRAIEEGAMDRAVNPLTQAPHTAEVVSADVWSRPYGREQAAYPAPWLRCNKFWPPVSRVDNAYGDRNLVALLPAPECG